MNIQELFIRSNQALLKSVEQIQDSQWVLEMPPGMSSRPTNLRTAVCYHTYDDAWIPDVLAGKTKTEVGEVYEPLLTEEKDVLFNYRRYNQRANDAVHTFTDLSRITHLSYGDFSAHDYLQHIISFRAFRSYDIAKLIGTDTKLDEDLVDALITEFTPVIEGYRAMGVFPAEIKVADDASPQEKLLALAGRV